MSKEVGRVESVCPECLERISAELAEDGDCVWMVKRCPAHGEFSAVVWRGQPAFTSWARPKIPFGGGPREAVGQGCPNDCGLCGRHAQRTCTALAVVLPAGLVRTMLLCSDYAPPALRRRIEESCGCETFLHYGTTETGLGGGVECGAHDGCHLRESELLFEIVDPDTGEALPDGVAGEVVVTTLGRRAMPLLRYRTGDLARLETGPCACGGVTARLCDVAGRGWAYLLGGGFSLTSRELDDSLFELDGLLDYRAILGSVGGRDCLGIEFQAGAGHERLEPQLEEALRRVPGVAAALGLGTLFLGPMHRVDAISPSHTVKRTISDQRGGRS